MSYIELNTDNVQVALYMRCRFDFEDEFNQIYDLKNYKRLDLSPYYFRSDLNLFEFDFIKIKLD